MATRTTKKAPPRKKVKPNRYLAVDHCNERFLEFDSKEDLDDRLGEWIQNECCNADDVSVYELVNVIEYNVELEGVKLTPRKK